MKLLNIKVLFDSRLFLKAYSLFKSFLSQRNAKGIFKLVALCLVYEISSNSLEITPSEY